MQTGKRLDVSMESNCLRCSGGPLYIDFLWGYVYDSCISCDVLCSGCSSGAQPNMSRNVVFVLDFMMVCSC